MLLLLLAGSPGVSRGMTAAVTVLAEPSATVTVALAASAILS